MQLMSEYQEVLRVLYDHRTILHTMTMRSVSGSFLVIQQILLQQQITPKLLGRLHKQHHFLQLLFVDINLKIADHGLPFRVVEIRFVALALSLLQIRVQLKFVMIILIIMLMVKQIVLIQLVLEHQFVSNFVISIVMALIQQPQTVIIPLHGVMCLMVSVVLHETVVQKMHLVEQQIVQKIMLQFIRVLLEKILLLVEQCVVIVQIMIVMGEQIIL